MSTSKKRMLDTPLGILGGGQLGRMTLQAASTLGIDVIIGDGKPGSPAGRLAQGEVLFNGGWDDDQAISAIASQAPVITLENEFVDAGVLEKLERAGATVLPSPDCVRTVQDKLKQKTAMRDAGIPVPEFRPVNHPDDLQAIGDELGWPIVLKARRDGYDGYGNRKLDSAADAQAACESLGWPDRELFVEQFIPFERELAVIVVRGRDGETINYPVVETRQDPELHICRVVLAPASIPADLAEDVARIARGAVESVGGTGTFGVELFHLSDDRVLVNELAPRPHNSGHYSIEGCVTSQFENHVRAVLGLPMGDPSLREGAAAMVNLLGYGEDMPDFAQYAAALSVPGVHLHNYGKDQSRFGRKMGHITACGSSTEEALERAQRAADQIRM
jgi:5-(carboxyamino)imidazole ribonucleotide synthase